MMVVLRNVQSTMVVTMRTESKTIVSDRLASRDIGTVRGARDTRSAKALKQNKKHTNSMIEKHINSMNE